MKNYCVLVLIFLIVNVFSQDPVRVNNSTFVYPCLSDSAKALNFVGLPLQTNYVNASDFDPSGININAVSKWNTELQGWETAGYHSALGWGTDFSVETGGGYIINAVNNFDFTVTGDSVDVVYNLITTDRTDMNMIVLPLTKSELTSAGNIGNDINYCNSLSKYDNVNQVWLGCTEMMSFWVGDFPTVIGTPLLINVTGNITWPSTVETILDNSVVNNNTPKSAGNGPRVVYFHVQDLAGGEFSYPEDAEGVVFDCWISGRESEILGQDDVGFGFSMIDGNSVAYINLVNFPTPWAVGDQLNFQFPNVAPQGNPVDNFILTEGADPIYRCFESIIAGTGSPLQIYDGTNSIEEINIPTSTTLQQNYPNPFNPTTTISFSILKDDNVKLSIYNIEGQLVKELVNGRLDRGNHSFNFNAESMISGEYIYTLEANGQKISNKMLLVK
ncbi:MAG: T9SS type A sorting domain-containing protein [Candidatus Delongbacteria bacterium]|jgi:hypothetical protein|nr:T9SS type A sorting domain-containing protein [Candidatus Delongbacteria bacterium]